MKKIYQMNLMITLLMLFLAFAAALPSPIINASKIQQEGSMPNEVNTKEMIVPLEISADENDEIKNNYQPVNKVFSSQFFQKPYIESPEAVQNGSNWIQMSLAEDMFDFSQSPSTNSSSQQPAAIAKRQGFIGLYHPFKGKVYAGTWINADEDLYKAYLFGVNGILNDPSYGEYLFKENVEMHCGEFDTNLVYGIILPPSERGVTNNPNDTKLWEPASSPGMIQAAARFSQLSRIFPQIKGVIIDDFWANYYANTITLEDMKNIKGALSGKRMNRDGTIDLGSPATTPDLQLFVVTYGSEIGRQDKDIFELIDGVNFWIYNQQDYYIKFDQYLNLLMANYPNKQFITGVYIHNSDYGDMSNQSISYMIGKGIKLYEKGLSPGVLLFAGHWLVKDYISEERSQQIGLSDILYSEYYPYLGEINCQVLDDKTSKPLKGAKIEIRFDTARKIAAAGKTTNEHGWFRFSGYAGRSGSISYSFIAEKEGYDPYKGSFILQANKTINLPPIYLKPANLIMFRNYEPQF